MNPWETYHASNQPLFRVGNVNVDVTTLFVAIEALGMIAYAIVGVASPLFISLTFDKIGILDHGRLWTLLTYAFVNPITPWNAIGLVFFFLFGRRAERQMGSRAFLKFLLWLILIPTITLSVVGFVFSDISSALPYSSSANLHLGVFIAFVWLNSDSIFWPGVPAKWFGVFFVAVHVLQLLSHRLLTFFWMAWLSLLVAYIFLRRDGMPMKFAPAEQALLNLIPKRRPKGYRSSKRKLKVVKERKSGRKVAYESKLAPKVDSMTSSAPVASIDHLLEKISKEGISSLSDKERKQLESASSELSDDEKPKS